MTGTTLHSVSRVLCAWAAQGIVASGRQKITICDPQALIAIADRLAGSVSRNRQPGSGRASITGEPAPARLDPASRGSSGRVSVRRYRCPAARACLHDAASHRSAAW